MTTRFRLADLPTKMKTKVEELRLKVQVASAAIAVLGSLFTNKERESLWGDACVCLENLGNNDVGGAH